VFSKSLQVAIAVIGATALLSVSCRAADDKKIAAETIIAKTIRPLMERQGIPGMAVGIVTAAGNWSYFYGVASKTTGNAVTGDTLFEIGSLSKTFTATLASYAAVTGHLALSDHASKYFPSLQGSSFDKISILNLGTHTSGGLPLQVPDQVANDRQLMDYFKTWTPAYAAGAYRQYSNPGIGLFGMISAKSLNGDFSVSMQRDVFRPLGLDHSFIDVPAAQMAQYAQGYTKTGLWD
jgi:beta-lactamase class C